VCRFYSVCTRRLYVCTCTRKQTHKHKKTHPDTDTRACTHTYTCIHTRAHTYSHMHTHKGTPTQNPTRTHAHKNYTKTCANAHLASVPVHPRVDEVCAGARTIRAPVSRWATWSRCRPFFAPTAVRRRRPLPGPAWTPPGYRSCKMGRRRPAPVPFDARPAPEGGTRAPPCLPHAFQIENWSANFRRHLSLKIKDTCALRFPHSPPNIGIIKQSNTHSQRLVELTNGC